MLSVNNKVRSSNFEQYELEPLYLVHLMVFFRSFLLNQLFDCKIHELSKFVEEEICTLPKMSGGPEATCYALQHRWFHNADTQECEQVSSR